MRNCLAVISFLLIVIPTSVGQTSPSMDNGACNKNVLFYLDVTYSVFNYGSNPAYQVLQPALNSIFSSDKILKPGNGYQVSKFDTAVWPVINYNGNYRLADKKQLLQSLGAYSESNADNRYDRLFQQISQDINSAQNRSNNYALIFSDFLYDTEKDCNINRYNNMRKNTSKAYSQLLEILAKKNFKLILIAVDPDIDYLKNTLHPCQHYLLMDELFERYPSDNVIIKRLGSNSAELGTADAFLKLLQGQITKGLTLADNGSQGAVELRDHKCRVKLVIKNDDCSGKRTINSIKIGPIRTNTGIINAEPADANFFDSKGEPITNTDSLTIPEGGGQRIIYAEVPDGLDINAAQKLRNSSTDSITVIIKTPEKTDTLVMSTVKVDVSFPEFNVSGLWSVSLEGLSSHNILRLVLEPKDKNEIVPENLKVEVSISSPIGNCNIERDTFILSPGHMRDTKLEPLIINYDKGCRYASNTIDTIFFTIMDDKGNVLQKMPPVLAPVKMISIGFVVFIILLVALILFSILLTGALRYRGALIKENKKKIRISYGGHKQN